MSENIEKIPFPVWQNKIFPHLPSLDLIRLGLTNLPFFKWIIQENEKSQAIWSHRIALEFPMAPKGANTVKAYQNQWVKEYVYPWVPRKAATFYFAAQGSLSNIENAQSLEICTRTIRLSALALACYHGHTHVLQYYIAVKQQLPEQFSGLHMALWGHKLDMAKYIIENVAFTNYYSGLNMKPQLPIHFACDAGFLDGVKYLVEELNQPLDALCFSLACGPRRTHALIQFMIDNQAPIGTLALSPLLSLLSSDDEDETALDMLLEAGCQARESFYYEDRICNPLYLALASNKMKNVDQLIVASNRAVLQDNTVLIAIDRGDSDVIAKLIALGVDLNVPYLVPGAQFNRAPLLHALYCGTLEIYQQLRHAGACEDKLEKLTGIPILQHAVQATNVAVVQDIVARKPQSVKERGIDGLTVLHRLFETDFPLHGCDGWYHELVPILINAGTPLDTVAQPSGRNLVDSCVRYNHQVDGVLKLIIRRGVTGSIGMHRYIREHYQHYHREYVQFTEAYNALNTSDMEKLKVKPSFQEFCDDVVNDLNPNCFITPTHKRWFAVDVLNDNVSEALTPAQESLFEYQRQLFQSSNRSKKQKAWAIEAGIDESTKLYAAVQLRNPLFFSSGQGSLLSRGGQRVVRLNSEFQSIRMVIVWVEQYIQLQKLKLRHSEKVCELTKALREAIESCPNLDSSDLDDLDTFLNGGLKEAIQSGRWGKGESKGWTQFLSVFTAYAENHEAAPVIPAEARIHF